MGLTKCHECGNKVSTEAAACPACGAPVEAERKPTKKKRSRTGCLVLGGLAIFVLTCAGVLSELPEPDPSRRSSAASDAPPKTWRDKDASTMAFVMIQEHVKRRLRAPSTAEFPYVTADGVRVEHLGEQVYMIQAYVDAENAFGGTVRTYFVGTMEQVERNKWQLRSLEFVER